MPESLDRRIDGFCLSDLAIKMARLHNRAVFTFTEVYKNIHHLVV